MPDLEYSALQVLEEGERRVAERGVTTWLAGPNPRVLEVVRRAGLDQRLGPGRLAINAREAVARHQVQQAQQAPAG